ncbi:alpha-mannosyltransferase, partial [Ascoidea rubescens DSM 1968]
LFTKVFQLLYDSNPKIPALNNYKSEERIYHAGYDSPLIDTKTPILTEDYLSSFLQLNDNELSALTNSHRFIVDNLPNKIDSNLYKGNGIVFVGGGKFNWLALLSIKSLRSVGSTLPIEVVIPTIEEYEIDLCARIFPALNAKCILLPHVLGTNVTSKFQFFGYQYKALALLVSSFENVLLLDSDNIPVHSPDYLFETEPFLSNGLICWPDFWKRATSPLYYKIAGIDISPKRVRYGYHNYGIYEAGMINEANEPDKIPLHDRLGTIPDPTTESGQLMISKKTHIKSLFLALYYNLYGPKYYYPLFSQGSDGEGDKETFLAAAVVLKKPYYQVNKFLNAFGYFNNQREFIGTGMGQFDPLEDYNILNSNLNILKNSKKLFKNFEEANNELYKIIPVSNQFKEDTNVLPIENKQPRILFVHANFPKLNPIELKETGKIIDENGNRIRIYGPGMAKRIGYDFELIQWKNMHFLVCELKIEIEIFKNYKISQVCNEILQQLMFLESTVDLLEKD